MVRVNFFPFIILFSLQAKGQVKKTSNSQEVALAQLEQIELQSNGALNNGKIKYSCKAKVETIKATSNQEVNGKNITLVCEFDNSSNLNAKIENIEILPYIYDKQTYYFFDASNVDVQFGKINLFATSCTTNTHTREILLNNCSGTYFDENKLINELTFFTKNPIKIKEMNVYINDIAIKNKILNFNIKYLTLNLNKTINAQNVSGFIENNIKLDVQNIVIKNKITKANNIKLEKDDIKITTEFLKIIDNNLLLPKTVNIKTKDLKLKAENGIQKGQGILLNNISFEMKNINGFSKAGYFDITTKALILEDGKINLQP